MITAKQQEIVMKAAQMLGYRLPTPDSDRMLKPFGHSMYVLFVKGDEFRLNSYFYGTNGELRCWNSEIFYEGDISEEFQIKLSQSEENLHHTLYPEFGRKLGFLTSQERTDNMMRDCGIL